ncbi:MAG: hypothetical protein OEY67_08650, partial [Gammaproteobacteria bacterium]|nr:hypothetical protein [Gammaproteobacteria bacterium]
AMQSLACALIDSFDVPLVSRENPMVRDIGWITVESEHATSKWRQDPDADVRFYIAMNPDYAKGHGLTVYVPLTFSNILRSFFHYLVKRSQHHRPGRKTTGAPRLSH